MKERFIKHTKHEYSEGNRVLTLLIAGIVFLGVLPSALVYFSSLIDGRFNLPHLTFGLINGIPGCALIILGIALAWWAIYVQFTTGRGTPVPIMATQQLIIQKPYRYCRNPMTLGTILAYTGVAILIGSISAVVLVLLGSVLLLLYIKLLEEKEMELRFGYAYLDYKKVTPFIIPHFRK